MNVLKIKYNNFFFYFSHQFTLFLRLSLSPALSSITNPKAKCRKNKSHDNVLILVSKVQGTTNYHTFLSHKILSRVIQLSQNSFSPLNGQDTFNYYYIFPSVATTIISRSVARWVWTSGLGETAWGNKSSNF